MFVVVFFGAKNRAVDCVTGPYVDEVAAICAAQLEFPDTDLSLNEARGVYCDPVGNELFTVQCLIYGPGDEAHVGNQRRLPVTAAMSRRG